MSFNKGMAAMAFFAAGVAGTTLAYTEGAFKPFAKKTIDAIAGKEEPAQAAPKAEKPSSGHSVLKPYEPAPGK